MNESKDARFLALVAGVVLLAYVIAIYIAGTQMSNAYAIIVVVVIAALIIVVMLKVMRAPQTKEGRVREFIAFLISIILMVVLVAPFWTRISSNLLKPVNDFVITTFINVAVLWTTFMCVYVVMYKIIGRIKVSGDKNTAPRNAVTD